MHIELLVFDLQLQLQGEVSEYTSLEIERNYDKRSMLILTLPCTLEVYQLLQPGRILTESDKTDYGYIVENIFYSEIRAPTLEIHAYSLNYMLSWRNIIAQQYYEGPFDHVIKQFVNHNAIATDVNRVIPGLILSSGSVENAEVIKSSRFGGTVMDHAFDICNDYNATIDVFIDHEAKQFVTDVWRGIDRSVNQVLNDHVMFSKELDNVTSQKYINLLTDYRTTAIVRGEEWYSDGHIFERINDEVSGFERREIFIESSLRSEFTDADGYNYLLDENDYRETLRQEGVVTLKSSHNLTESMEFGINATSEFILDQHYTVGDVVSLKNDNLGLVMHARVMQAKKLCDKAGIRLSVKFGTNTQTSIEKLAKAVKK